MYGLNSDKKAAFLWWNKVWFECGGKFYEDFMKITIPYISTNQIDLNNRPDSKPFWIPTYNSDC
jgi:hypothetical protein